MIDQGPSVQRGAQCTSLLTCVVGGNHVCCIACCFSAPCTQLQQDALVSPFWPPLIYLAKDPCQFVGIGEMLTTVFCRELSFAAT